MTIEDAIERFERQLNSAIVVLDSGFGTRPGEDNRLYRERKEMAEITLAALRAQQEAEKNAPLTLDELREMDGEPVWAVLLTKTNGNDSGWTLVYKNNGYSAAQRWTRWTLWYEDYGKTWLAYRRKPEDVLE